jgi:hypothetical protein
MFLRAICAAAVAAVTVWFAATASAAEPNIDTIRQEIQDLKKLYESRIQALEEQLKTLQKKEADRSVKASASSPAASGRVIHDNAFNPAIGVILNGKYTNYSADDSEIAGFAVGEEGERGREGLGIDESELNFSANADDKFYGHVTTAIVREDGEDKVELEEAYVQTLPGAAVIDGLSLKAGRAFWTLGYLNERHSHEDDFTDRPLPNRVFLNSSYNDDGIQASWVLPTDLYTEVGGGIFRGDDYPFGNGSGNGVEAWSVYARFGGDFGADHAWQLGGSFLSGDSDGRESNEGGVEFIGDSSLFITDFRYVWAPTGNPRQQELTLQGEYFWRFEDGTYEDSDAGTGAVDYDEDDSGWYLQAVYKFLPQWRVGTRYSRLSPANAPNGLNGSALDADGQTPQSWSLMADWTNSEFSRLRIQYSHQELSDGEDDQLILQYILSIGAHGAHQF